MESKEKSESRNESNQIDDERSNEQRDNSSSDSKDKSKVQNDRENNTNVTSKEDGDERIDQEEYIPTSQDLGFSEGYEASPELRESFQKYDPTNNAVQPCENWSYEDTTFKKFGRF